MSDLNVDHAVNEMAEIHLKATEFQPVSRELWGDFAAGFTRKHEGWLSTVAELETDLLERQPLTAYAASILIADEEPFQMLELDNGNPATCLVRAGAHQEIRHLQRDVVGVYLHCTGKGEQRGVRVDSGSNITLLVEVRAPAFQE